MPLLLNFVIEFRYHPIDNRMLKIITSAFIETRRLEKHSILKFICFKLLGHCNIFTFSLVFFNISWLSLCWLLDRSCLHFFSIWFLACVFWHTVFSICFLAYIVCFKKHFVSTSMVTVIFGIPIALTLLREHCRSLPEAVLVLTLKI